MKWNVKLKMNFFVSHRLAFIIGLFSLFLGLYLHDKNLHPDSTVVVVLMNSSYKRFFILGACLFAATASVFSLYASYGIRDILSRSAFYVNVLVFFFFTATLFFSMNRVLRRAHEYIIE